MYLNITIGCPVNRGCKYTLSKILCLTNKTSHIFISFIFYHIFRLWALGKVLTYTFLYVIYSTYNNKMTFRICVLFLFSFILFRYSQGLEMVQAVKMINENKHNIFVVTKARGKN